MEWLILIAAGGLGFYLYKTKLEPENKLKRLEEAADRLFEHHIADAQEAIEGSLKHIEEEKKGKTSSIIHIEEWQSLAKQNQEFKDRIRNLKINVTRLKERLAHAPTAERLAVAQDWYNYLNVISERKLMRAIDSVSETKDFLAEIEEEQQENKEFGAKLEEIEKRIDKKLAQD